MWPGAKLRPTPPLPIFFSLTRLSSSLLPPTSFAPSILGFALGWKKSFFEGQPTGSTCEALLPVGRPGPCPAAQHILHGDILSWLHLFHPLALLRGAELSKEASLACV